MSGESGLGVAEGGEDGSGEGGACDGEGGCGFWWSWEGDEVF